MKLSSLEKDMLSGSHGEAVKFAMKLVVKIGEIYKAKELIEISSSHILAHYGSLHDAGIDFMEKLVQLGAKCKVPTTVDPSSLPKDWKDLKIPEEYAKKQKTLYDLTAKMGVIQNWSCTPYECGNVPRFGQNIAWAESSAVAYTNSVIGARTNRTPAGLDISAAITGRMPKIGLYLDQNRIGEILIKVNLSEISDLDYHTIGYIVGKEVGTNIPVFHGIPKSCSNYNLKCLGSAAASSGAVSMFHIIGVTPEAIMCDPFNHKKPKYTIEIDNSKIEKATNELSTLKKDVIDLVTIGCPHLSLEELANLKNLLKDKKIKKDVKFWIYTSQSVYSTAREMGIVQEIEKTGAEFQVQTCPVISPLYFYGFKGMMTNSAKNANVVPTEHNINVIYRNIFNCISFATKRE